MKNPPIPEPRPAGRPPVDGEAAHAHIHLRVTMQRKNRYVKAAQRRRQTLSEWILESCDAKS